MVAVNLVEPLLIRMSQSGEIRTSFAPVFDNKVFTLQVMQIDGVPVLLAGGLFTEVNGQERIGVAVLDLDGTLRPELARLFPENSATVYAFLPVPERSTVLIGGEWEDVYESPGDAVPTTDGRYASLVEVEWPGGAVRQSFLAGETLDFGGSVVYDLAPGFGESGWTVALAGLLSVDDGGTYEQAAGAILDTGGELVAFTEDVFGALSVNRDTERDRYVFAGWLFDASGPIILSEYERDSFQLGRVVRPEETNPDAVSTTALVLPGGRVLAGGASLWFPDTGVIIVEPDGSTSSFSGEVAGNGITRMKAFSSGLYLGGDFFDFRTRDLFTGSVSSWIPANGLVRLRHDLTLDTSFVPAIDGDVTDIVELPPGTP